MVWSLALRSDYAKQDPVVYDTKFGVVFLAEGPRTASIILKDGVSTQSSGLDHICGQSKPFLACAPPHPPLLRLLSAQYEPIR